MDSLLVMGGITGEIQNVHVTRHTQLHCIVLDVCHYSTYNLMYLGRTLKRVCTSSAKWSYFSMKWKQTYSTWKWEALHDWSEHSDVGRPFVIHFCDQREQMTTVWSEHSCVGGPLVTLICFMTTGSTVITVWSERSDVGMLFVRLTCFCDQSKQSDKAQWCWWPFGDTDTLFQQKREQWWEHVVASPC